jgi:hypothetical protein
MGAVRQNKESSMMKASDTIGREDPFDLRDKEKLNYPI